MSKSMALIIICIFLFFACGKSSDQKNTLLTIGNNVRLKASTNSIPVWVGTADPIIKKNGQLFFKIFESGQKDIKTGFNLIKSNIASHVKFYIKQVYKGRLKKMKKSGKIVNEIDKIISSIKNDKLNKIFKIIDRYWEYWRIYEQKENSLSQSFTIYIYAETGYDALLKILTKKLSISKSADLKNLWRNPSFNKLP